jgi:glyoxylase-like metal-dependent hydrolase (beta-lactamase superfamily II)
MQINHFVCGSLEVNCYLVVDENTKKAFIVDPGGESGRLLNFVKENHIQVEYIILTHGHGDHIGGIDYYKNAFPGIKVVAHQAEQEMLEDPNLNHSKITCGKPISVRVDQYVADRDTLKVGKLEPVFLFTPGHTPGGMCIYVGNSLFSGDTLFAQSVGRTDFPKSSFTALKKSILNQLFILPDETKVYPGHMGTTTIGFEKEYNPFV